MGKCLKIIGLWIIVFLSTTSFAADRIRISVEINEKSAAAIGYTVGGKDFGTLGKSYVGTGPKNKKYVFGYRKNSILGKDIRCGEIVLTKNCTVVLQVKGNKCLSKIIY